MIYLITLNPAIDYYISVNNFKLNQTNYSDKNGSMVFGGKAINVSKILKNLDQEHILLTATSKKQDEFINSSLKNITKKLFLIDDIRVNIKLKSDDKITEINPPGMSIGDENKKDLETYILDNLKKDDIVLFAGKPHIDDYDYIVRLASTASRRMARVILDISNITINDLKTIKPFLIKPNEEEIKNLINENVELDSSIEKLLNIGVQNVAVTLGKDGLYFKSEGKKIILPSYSGKVINTVGAGDSFIGGYIYGLVNDLSITDTLQLAVASGSASAFSQDIATKEEIYGLLEETSLLK